MKEDIRRSSIAGTWYPGTERALHGTLEGYLALVDQAPVPGKLLALISPHAGYAYSGQTAAWAYKQVEGLPLRRVIVFAPSHSAAFTGARIFDGDAYGKWGVSEPECEDCPDGDCDAPHPVPDVYVPWYTRRYDSLDKILTKTTN